MVLAELRAEQVTLAVAAVRMVMVGPLGVLVAARKERAEMVECLVAEAAWPAVQVVC